MRAAERQDIVVLQIQGDIEHALMEKAACIFNKPSRQPSLDGATKVVAPETSSCGTAAADSD
jgi:hypothetical protein